MQATLLISLFLSATSITAARTLSSRQAGSIPLSIYDSAGCNNRPTPASIANIPTDGSCFPIYAILTANTDSGIIDTALATLPSGCTITLFTDFTCTSTNFARVTKAGKCFTFGAGRYVSSARTSGTC
ncbi:hypothetical protein BDV95DRAFT_619600 [Massariosphaeria phaeospora]|uniref:Uncharacterized protein n=1 Tax=Massariosphaeria phaeospora TaxID=100035 RepID=A0A7C8M789_9PLEO|nr:hypothetical protein BDV95DRAFT_619600 [Massariosphaeria phaeospora]